MKKEIDEFLIFVESRKKVSENTIKAYRSDLIRLYNYAKKNNLNSWNDFTEDRINAYMVYLSENFMTNSTIARMLSSIRLFFSYLYESGEVDHDAAQNVGFPKVEKKLPKILTRYEIERLLEMPGHKTPKAKRDSAIIELMYATGLKVGEIITLNINDIDFRINCINLGDDYKKRVIPFGNHARAAVMDYLMGGRLEILGDEKDDGTLFLSAITGKAISRQGIWKMLRKYGKMADIKIEITPDVIRHTFTAHMIENGADTIVLQEMLGLSNMSYASGYLKNKNNYVREIYERMGPRN